MACYTENQMPKKLENKLTTLIIPGKATGAFSLSDMEEVLNIAQKYHIPGVKITSAKRLAFFDVNEKHKTTIESDLNRHFGVQGEKKAGYVIACQERNRCKHACFTLDKLTAKIENLLSNLSTPAKVKIGISSCPRNCCASYTKDVGIFATLSGWTVVFGGNAGAKPRIADIVIEGVSDKEALVVVEKCLAYYMTNAKRKERTARFVERVGIEALRKETLS